MSNEFKNKALLNALFKKYKIEITSSKTRYGLDTNYFLKLNVDNVFIHCKAYIFQADFNPETLINTITTTVNDFNKFLDNGARDIHYFKYQVSLQADFELRESIYSISSSDSFIYDILDRNDKNILKAFNELQTTTLEPYLKKQRLVYEPDPIVF